MLAALIAFALLQWNATFAIEGEFFTGGSNWWAQTGAHSDHCLIGVNEPWFTSATPELRQSVITHEVGHCLGLGHFGSCNYNEAIMGCATLGEITGYDRAMLGAVRGNRVVVPMVGN